MAALQLRRIQCGCVPKTIRRIPTCWEFHSGSWTRHSLEPRSTRLTLRSCHFQERYPACAKIPCDGRRKQRQDRGCGCGVRWCRCWRRWWGNGRRLGTRRSRRCNGTVGKYRNWVGSRCWRGDCIRRLPALQETEVNVGLQLRRRSRERTWAAALVLYGAAHARVAPGRDRNRQTPRRDQRGGSIGVVVYE